MHGGVLRCGRGITAMAPRLKGFVRRLQDRGTDELQPPARGNQRSGGRFTDYSGMSACRYTEMVSTCSCPRNSATTERSAQPTPLSVA
jgi:hypothetical protein